MKKIHTLAYVKIIALLTVLLICSHTKAQLPERHEGLALYNFDQILFHMHDLVFDHFGINLQFAICYGDQIKTCG